MRFEASHETGKLAGIVCDGQRCAHQALFANVRNEIEAQYSREMREAALWRRVLLRLKVRREIRRHLEKAAPKEALYLHRG